MAREYESDRADGFGLRALVALHDVELDALIVLQLAVAFGLHRRVVHEHVGAVPVRADEAEALFGVEPFYGAGRHENLSSYADRTHARPCGPPVRGPSQAAAESEKETDPGNRLGRNTTTSKKPLHRPYTPCRKICCAAKHFRKPLHRPRSDRRVDVTTGS